MSDTLLTMPKKTASIRVDAEVARRAGIIAAAAGMSTPDWISDRLKKVVDKEFQKTVKGLSREAGVCDDEADGTDDD